MFSIENEPGIRLGFFIGVFAVMAALEYVAPRRTLSTFKPIRWFNNLSVTFIDSLSLHLIFPFLAVETAYISAERGWGIFNNIELPVLMEGILAVIILDFLIYAQHVAFHHVKPLWRLHMMHHTDLDIDVTTGSRFHPIEILMSMGIKMFTVVLMGAPAWSVLAFEVILNATAMFNHSNFYLPLTMDRIMRLFVVTPDMHRVHHSVIIKETNSNYGFNLPWWDRLCKTYRRQPVKGHDEMLIGLANFRDPKEVTLPRMLAIPFTGKER